MSDFDNDMNKDNEEKKYEDNEVKDESSSALILPSMEMSLTGSGELSLMPDPEFDFEDIKCQFDEQVPFYEKTDYAVAAACGMITAVLDIVCVGETSLLEANKWGTDKVESFVKKAARLGGYKGNDLQKAVEYLEKHFHMAGDSVADQFGGGLQHHLRDFSHHPTIVGLAFSLLTQFTGYVYGTDNAGAFQMVKAKRYIGENTTEKILFGTVYWMFHLISDMAGTSGAIGRRTSGTGIPGPLLATLKEFSALPFFKCLKNEDGINSFSLWLSKLFNGTSTPDGVRFDLRTELGLAYNQVKHSLPVLLNELLVRGYYLVSRVCVEISSKKIKKISQLDQIDLKIILPFKQRKLTRMLTISSGTFLAVATAPLLIKSIAAQNPIVFFINLNYAAVFRFAVAVYKDMPYMVEGVKTLKEEFEQRETERNRFFAEQDIGISYFALTEKQGSLLDSLKYQKISYDIENSSGKKAALKTEWQNKWTDSVESQTISRIIKEDSELYIAIDDELRDATPNTWMHLIAMELDRFVPYYPFGTTKEEDKKYKTLKLHSNYEDDKFMAIQNCINRDEFKLLKDRNQHYGNILSGNNYKIAIAVGVVVVGAATGGAAFLAAPQIAVVLAGGAFEGLSGAALTSASLAAVGGGSLAAGGLGMSGGTAIITGGGALLGLLSSGGVSATTLGFFSSKDNVIAECASILTYCDVVLSKMDNSTEILKNVHDYLERSYEEWAANLTLMETSHSKDKDKKLIKATKDNMKYIEHTIKELKKLMN